MAEPRCIEDVADPDVPWSGQPCGEPANRASHLCPAHEEMRAQARKTSADGGQGASPPPPQTHPDRPSTTPFGLDMSSAAGYLPTPEENGNWLIAELVDEARLTGHPLSSDEVELLRTPIWRLTERQQPSMVSLNSRLVPLARGRMDRAKRGANGTARVRRGLRIPREWHERYTSVFASELPWPIAGVMQNAMMVNPGERKPWRSP